MLTGSTYCCPDSGDLHVNSTDPWVRLCREVVGDPVAGSHGETTVGVTRSADSEGRAGYEVSGRGMDRQSQLNW